MTTATVLNGPTATTGAESPSDFTISAGSNRKLVYFLRYNDSARTATVTYGGQSMTQVTTSLSAGNDRYYVFELGEAGIAAASNDTIAVTYSPSGPATTRMAHVLVALQDCVQIPFTTVETDSTNGTPMAVGFAGDVGGIALAFCSVRHGTGTGSSHTWSGGFTESTDSNTSDGDVTVSSATRSVSASNYTATCTPADIGASSNASYIVALVEGPLSVTDLSPIGVSGGSYDNFSLKTDATVVELVGRSANANLGQIIKARVLDAYTDLSPYGGPRGKYNYANDRSQEIVGTEGTTALGDLTVSGAAVADLTQTALTASLGTLEGVIPVTVSLTGTAGTGAVGDFSFVTDQVLDLTTSALTASLGDISTPGAIVLDDVAGTGTLGTLAISSAQILTLTGVEGTGAVATLDPLVDSNVAITGTEGTGTLGSITVDVPVDLRDDVSELSVYGGPGGVYNFTAKGGTGVTVSITGVEAATAIADFNANSLIEQPDGTTGTGASGDTGESTDQLIVPTGVEGTGAVGGLIITQDIVLTGVQGTSRLGALAASTPSSASVPIEGNEGTATLGTLSPSVDAKPTLTGVAGTGLVVNGLAPPDELVYIVGVEAIGTAEELPQVVAITGRRRKKPKRRWYVEIDDQIFIVDTQREAQALLDQAAELAERTIAETPEVIPEKPKIRVLTASGKPSQSLAINAEVARTNARIDRAVRNAASTEIDREIAELIHLKIEQDHDEELAAILLLVA